MEWIQNCSLHSLENECENNFPQIGSLSQDPHIVTLEESKKL